MQSTYGTTAGSTVVYSTSSASLSASTKDDSDGIRESEPLLPMAASEWQDAGEPHHHRTSIYLLRLQVSRVVHNVFFQWAIVILIVLNAVILGLETIPELSGPHGYVLHVLNWICMAIFITEVAAKLFAEGVDFFKNGWNYFDVIVLALSVAPRTGPWSAFYALRCLRVLRIVSTAKPVKLVAESFVVSLYTASPVFALLFLILYIASLLGVSFFGSAFPEWFGTLPHALFTMFQVVTLESWSMGIARPIMEVYPYAWAFFVPFITLSTWTVLNLFIGVVVNTISEIAKRYAEIEEAQQRELDSKIARELSGA